MNDVVYRPYKTQTWALIFAASIGIVSFAVGGYCLTFFGVGALCFIGVGVVCMWLTKLLYDSSKRAVVFEQNGLRILGSCSEYLYIPWDKLVYGCYTNNYKGHQFLVLSQTLLNSTEAKHFANRGANSSRIIVDDIVVIYLDALQDIGQIKELISIHISQIDTLQ